MQKFYGNVYKNPDNYFEDKFVNDFNKYYKNYLKLNEIIDDDEDTLNLKVIFFFLLEFSDF